MKTFKLLLIGSLVISIAIISCSKGSTGPQGPAGPAGTNGTNGTNGTDSVLYSAWDTLSTPYDTTAAAYTDTIQAPAITQSIIDSGLVISYVKDIYGNTGTTVDITEYITSGVFVTYGLGTINISSGFDMTG